jgi:hypothetical protein
MDHYGQVDAASTVRIFFTTHAASGASVAPSSAFEAADVRIYKNGSATQRTSEAGYTMTSPFDTVTGLHLLSIDLSDNTDAGFYAAGNRYSVILVPDETVDALAVVRVLADFSIGPVKADAVQIDSSASAATHLKDHAVTAVPVTFAAGGSTTTAILVNVDGAAASSTDDFYNGRVLIFTAPSGLQYQATDISDYVGATKTATITQVTTAPDATTTAIMV